MTANSPAPRRPTRTTKAEQAKRLDLARTWYCVNPIRTARACRVFNPEDRAHLERARANYRAAH